MTQTQGDYAFCLQTEGSKWLQTRPLKFEMKIDLGDMDLSRDPATHKEFKAVEQTFHATLARAEAIKAENEYEKTTEFEFRDASERMNSHVVLVAIFIMVVEAALIGFQIHHLRSFFKREKMI